MDESILRQIFGVLPIPHHPQAPLEDPPIVRVVNCPDVDPFDAPVALVLIRLRPGRTPGLRMSVVHGFSQQPERWLALSF
jgi:hypothetical protein